MKKSKSITNITARALGGKSIGSSNAFSIGPIKFGSSSFSKSFNKLRYGKQSKQGSR
jgi:hypothetical protein